MTQAAVEEERQTALVRAVEGRTTSYALVGGATALDVEALLHHHAMHGFVAKLLDYGPAVLLILALGIAWRRAQVGKPPALDRRVVLGCCALALSLAAIGPVRNSADLWAYAMYGRVESVHHESAYTHVPADFPHDPYLARMSPRWRHTASVYGPVFNEYASVVTRVTGSSANATRLAFKMSAAFCVLASLLLLDRRRVEPAALALAGLHPATIMYGVAGGHNDATVGLGVLVAVLLATRRKPLWAALAIAFACLVKVAVGLAILGLAVWLWYRPGHRGRREAAIFAGTSLGTVGVGYLLAGGPKALVPLRTASRLVSWNSYWRPVARWLAHTPFQNMVSLIASAVVLLLVVLLLSRHRHDVGPEVLVTALLLGYLVASAYSLTWYVLWVLPVAALRWRTASSWLVVLVATAYLLPPPDHDGLYLTAIGTVVVLMGASIWHHLRPRDDGAATAHATPAPLSPS